MSEWIALSRTHHANSRYLPRKDYSFARQRGLAPILLPELGRLLPHYALGFVEQQSQYLPVALVGLSGDRNLYVDADGSWLASYVPAELRGYPFTLADGGENRKLLCVDSAALVTDQQGAEPLFDAEGGPSESVQQSMSFLERCDGNRRQTLAAAAALAECGLIAPWPLEVARGDDQPSLEVAGLFRIDEKALNELPAEQLAGLRASGALSLAYAQLLSMFQLDQLRQRALYQQHKQTHQTQPASEASLFDDRNDDLTFDFGD